MNISAQELSTYSNVNVYKTNSFFRPNLQFVSISKRNVLFYSHIAVIGSKKRTIWYKKSKKINKMKRNEFSSESN
jgi:hypothetical protein